MPSFNNFLACVCSAFLFASLCVNKLYRSAGPSAAAVFQVIPASSSAAERTDRVQKRSGGKASAATVAAAAGTASTATVATVPDEEKGAATVILSALSFDLSSCVNNVGTG